MVEATVHQWGDITKEFNKQIEALKELTSEPAVYGEENIIAVIHVRRQRPICIV